ncbi:MAG: hypothetical protein EBV05_14480, partial [Cyanobacteria bacterium WB6_1B_304]|nr:hypothetical protein [Cyanobacteria bacterium WB6_1B_304]
LKKAKEVQSKIEAERRQEAWIETDDDEELVLSDITPPTMQDSTSKKSKYSKESIRKLEISMREQQLQMELRLAETQRQAQMDANRKMEEGFERLITMFAERTPEKVTNNRSSREVAQRKRDSLIQSTSMAGTAIDLSLPLRTPTVVNRVGQTGHVQERQLYQPVAQDYFAGYLQGIPISSANAFNIPTQIERGMDEQSIPVLPLQVGNGYVYNQQQPGQTTNTAVTTGWGQPIIPRTPLQRSAPLNPKTTTQPTLPKGLPGRSEPAGKSLPPPPRAPGIPMPQPLPGRPVPVPITPRFIPRPIPMTPRVNPKPSVVPAPPIPVYPGIPQPQPVPKQIQPSLPNPGYKPEPSLPKTPLPG